MPCGGGNALSIALLPTLLLWDPTHVAIKAPKPAWLPEHLLLLSHPGENVAGGEDLGNYSSLCPPLHRSEVSTGLHLPWEQQIEWYHLPRTVFESATWMEEEYSSLAEYHKAKKKRIFVYLSNKGITGSIISYMLKPRLYHTEKIEGNTAHLLRFNCQGVFKHPSFIKCHMRPFFNTTWKKGTLLGKYNEITMCCFSLHGKCFYFLTVLIPDRKMLLYPCTTYLSHNLLNSA